MLTRVAFQILNDRRRRLRRRFGACLCRVSKLHSDILEDHAGSFGTRTPVSVLLGSSSDSWMYGEHTMAVQCIRSHHAWTGFLDTEYSMAAFSGLFLHLSFWPTSWLHWVTPLPTSPHRFRPTALLSMACRDLHQGRGPAFIAVTPRLSALFHPRSPLLDTPLVRRKGTIIVRRI